MMCNPAQAQQTQNAAAMSVWSAWRAQAPGQGNSQSTQQIQAWTNAWKPPLKKLDACPGCGKSGEEIMAAGETYKTHGCFPR